GAKHRCKPHRKGQRKLRNPGQVIAPRGSAGDCAGCAVHSDFANPAKRIQKLAWIGQDARGAKQETGDKTCGVNEQRSNLRHFWAAGCNEDQTCGDQCCSAIFRRNTIAREKTQRIDPSNTPRSEKTVACEHRCDHAKRHGDIGLEVVTVYDESRQDCEHDRCQPSSRSIEQLAAYKEYTGEYSHRGSPNNGAAEQEHAGIADRRQTSERNEQPEDINLVEQSRAPVEPVWIEPGKMNLVDCPDGGILIGVE